MKRSHEALLDSGSERCLVGQRYLAKLGWKSQALDKPIQLQYMDGKGPSITRATFFTFRVTDRTGDVRKFTTKFLVADIPETLVLGMTWLEVANPIVDWIGRSLTWRESHQTFCRIRRARKRIVQGAIQANDAPEWVQKEFADVLRPRDPLKDGLPPHRGEWDYRIRMRPTFRPRREPMRVYKQEHKVMAAELAKTEYNNGRWRLGDGPQGVQMTFAAKAGGETRPCIDYRPINAHMQDDAFPVPLIKELMTQIAGKRILCSLDLPKAYWEIRNADKETEDLLAFICNGTLYAPRVMQFGSKTAVQHFQRFITMVLHDYVGKGCLVYLDNIVLAADTQEEMDALIRGVLEALRKHKLSLQPKKCEWNKEEVQFCGFLVSKHGTRIDPEKVRAVSEWEPPRADMPEAEKKTRVREFHGFCNFLRDAIGRFSEISEPLTRVMGPKAKWEWGPQQQTAWQLLKTATLASPSMAVVNMDIPIEMYTDASDKAEAGVLVQKQADGTTRPLGFHSKKFTGPEINRSTHDKELGAILHTLQKFEAWCQSNRHPVKVWSDHQALTKFLESTNLRQRHARWAQELGEYNFVIHHIKGKDNAAADALSRKWNDGTETGGAVAPLRLNNFDKSMFRGATYALSM
jgi:hypothetical protein